MRFKKFLSLLLSVTLLLSCMSVTAFAEDDADVKFGVSAFQKYDTVTHKVLDDEVTEVKAGDILVVTFSITNVSSKNLSIGAYDAEMTFDAGTFTGYIDVDDEDWIGPFYESYGQDVSSSSFTVKVENGKASIHGATASGVTVKKNTTTPIGKIALKVAADAESAVADFAFNASGKNQAATKDEVDLKAALGAATLTVKGVTPTLSKVELSETTATANAKDKVTLSATATSAKGTNITGSVAWSVSPADGGVSIAEDGKITVAAKAKAGKYTVTATPVANKSLGEAKTAKLTVQRDTPAASEIAITGGAAIMEIPTGESVSTTYTAEVKDQYGDKMEKPSVTWSIAPDMTGVAIDINGKVTVSSSAKDAIGTSQDFTITAKAADGVTDMTTLTVKRSEAKAETVTVTPNKTDVTVPTEGTASATFTAVVKDQYGADFSGTVEWSIAPEKEGVSVSNGVVTVTPAAAKYVTPAGTEMTVKATCGEAVGTAALTIKREDAKATSITIDGPASAVIPTTGAADKTYTYTAKVFDQYGIETGDKAALSLTSTDDKVSFNATTGVLTVKAGAEVADYTLTATCGDATQTMTIKVVNKLDAEVSISDLPETVTYGDAAFTLTATAANQAATTGTWSWTSSDTKVLTVDENGKVTVVGAGKATVTATYEDETYYGTKSVEINVAKKTLILTGLTVDSKTYDGKTVATLDTINAKLEGVVGDDKVNFAFNSVEGSNNADFSSANVGTWPVTVNVEFVLTGADEANYTLTQPSGLTGTITEKEIEIASATATGRGYEKGNKNVTVAVTFKGVVDGESLTLGTDYTVTGEMETEDAGSSKSVNVTVTLNANSNYTLKSDKTTTTVKIDKIDWTGDKTIKTSGKYGSTVTVDISFLPAYTGGTLAVELLTPVVESQAELQLKLTDDSSKVGKTAKYTVELQEMTNYNNFTLTVEIEILDKAPQTLTADEVSKTYGDVFTVSVNGAKTDVTYAVKSGSESVLSYAEGKFTALKSGEATIVATADETADYKSATVDIPVTIAKREMTVTANDVSIYVGETVPALTYTASGMLPSDSWTTEPTLTTSPATVDTSKVSEYEIIFVDPVGVPTGDYHITYVPGKLSVTTRPVVVPPSGNAVTVAPTTNGRVNVSTGSAIVGGTVTVTTTPDQGYELSDLLVTDRLGNQLPVTDLGNGRFSFVMPAASVTVSAAFAQVKQSGYYADVLPNAWYYDAVQYVTEQGLMSGTGKGFEPDLTTSRAMIWTILARMDGMDTTVTSGSWYAIAQAWAMENGVSDGTDPNGLITREQLAAMLYRYAVSKGVDVSVGEDTNILSYADATSVSEWAVSAMQWACGAGIINGVDGSLLPQGNATRAQTATMLMRYLELVK